MLFASASTVSTIGCAACGIVGVPAVFGVATLPATLLRLLSAISQRLLDPWYLSASSHYLRLPLNTTATRRDSCAIETWKAAPRALATSKRETRSEGEITDVACAEVKPASSGVVRM